MKNFIKSVISQPWLIILGMYVTALLGILFPSFAEWPLVPVLFMAFVATFDKNLNPRWDRFTAMALGSLSVQALFWIA